MQQLRLLLLGWLVDTVFGECRETVPLINHKLDIPPLNKTSDVTEHVACLNSCQDDSRCQSYNYDQLTKVCEHLNETQVTQPCKVLKRLNWIHISNPWHPCPRMRCLNGGACVMLTNGSHLCHCPPRYRGERCQDDLGTFITDCILKMA